MNSNPHSGRRCIEWAVASQATPGQSLSGDRDLVATFPDGAMAAVVDGLGHGNEASIAAKAAIDVLAAQASESLIPLVRRCHQALRNTRGAVMTLVSFSAMDDTVTALGIGNVEAVLLRADRSAKPPQEIVLLRGGIVGDQLPALHASLFPVHAGDLLILATDGIRENFWEQVNVADPPQQLADRILARSCRGTDDALVLVIRYRGRFDA